MAAYPFQRESRRARWAWRLATFALALLLVSTLGHRLDVVETPAFLVLAGLVALLALAALAMSWAALARLWQVDEKGIGRAFAAALVALLVLAPFALGGVWWTTHPRLSDISTDLIDPPMLRHAAATRSGPMNEVAPIDAIAAEEQRRHYPAVTPRRYEHERATVEQVVRAIASRKGWRLARLPDPRMEGAGVTIELEARTLVFGFVSDVAIRLRDQGGTTQVDMRSASRYGEHDFGDNARRITAFLERLDEDMEALPVMPVE
ncbi:MAG: DUF1499 domain-containing protein [Rhizobiaceae bacterium]